MHRLFIAFVIVGAQAVSALGQDKDTPRLDGPIAAELAKAEQEYLAATQKTAEKLLAAFADQQKKLEENKQLKVEQQINLIEVLMAEKKAFAADRTRLPVSSRMKADLEQYRTQMAAAQTKCEAAFDKVAKGLVAKKDMAAAQVVLERKEAFIANQKKPTLAGKYKDIIDREVTLQADGAATRLNNGKLVAGKWTDNSGTLEVKWESGWTDRLTLNKEGTALVGEQTSPRGEVSAMKYKIDQIKAKLDTGSESPRTGPVSLSEYMTVGTIVRGDYRFANGNNATGDWKLHIKERTGKLFTATYSAMGTGKSTWTDFEITGEIQGDTIKFAIDSARASATVTGTLKKDRLELDWVGPGNRAKLVAKIAK